jgi:hypothetical protein
MPDTSLISQQHLLHEDRLGFLITGEGFLVGIPLPCSFRYIKLAYYFGCQPTQLFIPPRYQPSLVSKWSWLDNSDNRTRWWMACCSWSTNCSITLIICILHKIVFRFTFRLSLYDSQLVLLGSLKVIWFIVMLHIWKHMCLLSDNTSSDTCQLLTRFAVLFVPSVKSITLLQSTKAGSLPW